MAVEFRVGRHHQAADNELRISEDHRQPRRGVDRLELLEERLVQLVALLDELRGHSAFILKIKAKY